MEMNSQKKEVFEFLRRWNVVETIEQDCPPCPDCNDNEIINIEASHIPPTFNINPNYPKGCNERNYLIDTQEKSKIVKYANDFNPQFLLNDDKHLKRLQKAIAHGAGAPVPRENENP